jgi:hypothetical protein
MAMKARVCQRFAKIASVARALKGGPNRICRIHIERAYDLARSVHPAEHGFLMVQRHPTARAVVAQSQRDHNQ